MRTPDGCRVLVTMLLLGAVIGWPLVPCRAEERPSCHQPQERACCCPLDESSPGCQKVWRSACQPALQAILSHRENVSWRRASWDKLVAIVPRLPWTEPHGLIVQVAHSPDPTEGSLPRYTRYCIYRC